MIRWYRRWKERRALNRRADRWLDDVRKVERSAHAVQEARYLEEHPEVTEGLPAKKRDRGETS